MSNASFDHALFDAPPTTERPLGMSMLASALLHVVVIALLASARPTVSLLPTWRGATATLQVDLQQPAVSVPEHLPEPMTVISVPEPAAPTPAPTSPKEPIAKLPLPNNAPRSAGSSPEFSVRTGSSTPSGSITVGLIYKPEQLSLATGARLAQRFPVLATRTPKLNGAVIARYPTDAARAHQSTRIAAVLTVDASGKVIDGDTMLVPDDSMFHDAVLAAIASAKFTPAELDGKPIPYWVILNFFFDIDSLPGVGRR